MKQNLFFLIVGVLSTGMPTVASCSSAEKKSDAASEHTPTANTPVDSLDLNKLFTLSDAERILGEKAYLKRNTLTVKDDDVSTYECTYTTNAKDQKTGNTGTLYVILEDYPRLSSAEEVYNTIKKANENHEGVRALDGIGDEAYFHSDGKNFYFILARKQRKILRIKVNKITANTSLNEFNRIAKKVVELL